MWLKVLLFAHQWSDFTDFYNKPAFFSCTVYKHVGFWKLVSENTNNIQKVHNFLILVIFNKLNCLFYAVLYQLLEVNQTDVELLSRNVVMF